MPKVYCQIRSNATLVIPKLEPDIMNWIYVGISISLPFFGFFPKIYLCTEFEQVLAGSCDGSDHVTDTLQFARAYVCARQG